MHELSLAQSLIDQLLALAEEHKASKVSKVNVVIGPFSGVVADSFSFGFDALKTNHEKILLAELILDRPAPTYYCLDCQNTFSTQLKDTDARVALAGEYSREKKCPHCSSRQLSPKGGCEMILKQIEME